MVREMKSRGHHDNLIYRERRGNRPNKSSSRDRVIRDAERSRGRRQSRCSADIEMRFFHPEGGEAPTAKSVRVIEVRGARTTPCPRPSFLPRPLPISSPEDEKCIKHYRHSVSCEGQHPPIERRSSFRSPPILDSTGVRELFPLPSRL